MFKELADELAGALDRHLHGDPVNQDHYSDALREALWDNKAGIVAALRFAAQQDGAREADRIGLAKALFEADRLEYADEAIARSWNEMHKFIDDPDYAYKHPSWRAELIAARDQFLRMADAALMHLHRHEQGSLP